ncbi:hypothetical protein EU527_10755 [Candidatus Thorarchaeota archaeon]|nr:MAG: hypothetical protein EU527_10755 [Candidatus Thorarchaeota archaeon]
MTELHTPILRRQDILLRAFAIMAAGVLLNIGLFFMLGILTPLFVGIIVGYIVGEKWLSLLASTFNGLLAYSMILFATNGGNPIIIILEAIILMTMISLMGGLLGYFVQTKFTRS